jgi:membrane protease subunit HflC
MRSLGSVLVLAIGILIVLSLSLFTVAQYQNAIVFQFGEVVRVVQKPGLYFKVPLVQNVRNFDVRIRTLDAREPERFITSEKKNVLVDSFVKWRIIDVKQYYISVAGDEVRAQTRLAQTVNDDLRAQFGKRTVHDVVSGQRDQIMEILRTKADQDARAIGVQVLDVRLKRVDLFGEPATRTRQSASAWPTNCPTGAGEAEKLRRGSAERSHSPRLIATRSAARARVTPGLAIYAARSVRIRSSMPSPQPDAYRGSLRNKSDLMILDPNADFFKYFKAPAKPGK